MHHQSGALPLLQHALLELWNKREGRRLSVKAYQEIGKLEGALQRRADATLKAFSQDEQELCRRTFLRLTQPGEGTEDTKRRASMQELLSLSGKSTAEEDIIQKLADASLLTTEGDLTHRDAFVEVARRAIVAAGAAVAALILLVMSVVMWRAAQQQARIADEQRVKAEQQTRAAEEQARIAESRRLAAESSSGRIQYPQRSLLLAVEAVKAGQSLRGVRVAAAEQSLREALSVVGGRPLVHSNSITAVAISPDNHWLVTGSWDNRARLWDLSAKDPAANPVVLRGHEGAVNVVGISPDNHWLVTGSWDNTARLWDLSAKDPAANPVVLCGHKDDVKAVGISPDNHWLVTGSADNTARLWLLQMRDLVKLARITVRRNFSAYEWQLYFPGEPYHKTFPDLPGP